MAINNPMTRDQLQRIAPSVFAESRCSTRSEKYVFVPTIQIVEKLASEGWLPVRAVEQRVRNELRQGYQKHQLRFRKYDGTMPTLAVGDSLVEMVLMNSHDGSSAYELNAGLFRLVCTNGLVVSSGSFGDIKIKHKGFNPRDIIEASYRIIDSVPQLQRDVKTFESVKLSAQEQEVMAKSALALRYDDAEKAPNTRRVLMARRQDDLNPSLWHTYNRIQENMIKGGLGRAPIMRNGDVITQRRTREVKGIDENTKLNKALWTLTSEMAKLKAA